MGKESTTSEKGKVKITLPKDQDLFMALVMNTEETKVTIEQHMEEHDCSSCPGKDTCELVKAANGDFDDAVNLFKGAHGRYHS